MEKLKLTHILVDTNALYKFWSPDFQMIVKMSKDRRFKIIVPHIVWEERRTQWLDDALDDVQKLRSAYSTLERRKPESILGRLDLPPFSIWEREQIVEASRVHMADLAKEYNIEVIPLDPRHAERAWVRYFDVSPPFKPEEIRLNRRKDIPDSWIFESAIDLFESHKGLVALCEDGKLVKCFESIDVPVFKTAADLVTFLEQEGKAKSELDIAKDGQAPIAADDSDQILKLDQLLERLQHVSRDAEQKILGFIGYLGLLTKRDLGGLLELAGVSPELGRNAAERLVLNGLIQDTGNAYLPRNKEACELAAVSVEPLMIEFVAKA